MNPIVGRELRSRWRERRAFGLVLGYSAVLSLAMLWLCHELLRLPEQTAQLSISPRRTGYAIFVGLSWMQTLGWMLLAPALTATTIAGEREQGLLENLQLAPLSPRQIAWGKLASALLFALVLWSCALPVSALCFMLGGVSPGQYLMSSLIQLVTAMTGAIVGLYFSAWSHRAGAALRKTFAALIVWNIGSLLCAIIPVGSGLTTRLLYLVGSSNPIGAVLSLLEGNSRGIYVLRSRGFTPFAWWIDFLVDLPPWVISLTLQGIVSTLLFTSVVRALRRPLPEQYWIERSRSRSGRDTSSTQNASTRRAGAPQAGTSNTKPRAFDAMWWEVPVTRLLRFTNPLLQREVHGKFRMRRVPLAVIVIEALLGLSVVYFYGLAVWWALTDPRSRQLIWGVIGLTMLIVVMIASAMMGAGAFSREREVGTFEALFLSQLSNREIVLAKLFAPLIANCVYGLPLVPLLVVCIRGLSYPVQMKAGISGTQAVSTLLVLAATAWCYTAWGMLMSWLCRRTSPAIGWTVGTLFIATVFLPIFLAQSGPSTISDLLWLVHPLYAFLGVMEPRDINPRGSDPLPYASLFALVSFSLGTVILALLHRSMRARAREADGRHGARSSSTR